ncbi:MAG: FAD-dependent oxidoreductase [Chloroflexota bacterium]
MTVSYWQDNSPQHTMECDVCVVGAGIVGLYLARLIAGQGLSTTVLEARHVAAGASGRNAGMVLTGAAQHYYEAVRLYGRERALDLWNLSLHNRDIVRGLSEEFGTPYDAAGSLLLAVDDTEAEDLERTADAMLDDNIQVKFTHKDPTGRGFSAAIFQPGDAGIHPARFAQALAGNCGAEVWEQSEVFGWESLPDGSIEVRSRRTVVRCRMLALCTNAYAPLMHPYFEDKVQPTRGQILVTEPVDHIVLSQLCYADYGYEYFRQLPDGRFVLGGWRHHFREMEVGYEDRTTPEVQGGLESFMARYFPDVVGARITHRWSGTMGFSKDGLPLVGSLPEEPNVFFAVGFTGHGLGFGLATAERLAAHMLLGSPLMWLDAKRLEAAPNS